MTVKIIEYGDFNEIMETFTKEGILETCINVRNEARSLSPVGETGDLRQSITYQTGETGGGLSVNLNKNQGAVGSALDYSIYQEFGTRHMKPQPFLRPAVSIWAYGNKADAVLKKRAEEVAKGNLSKTAKRETFF